MERSGVLVVSAVRIALFGTDEQAVFAMGRLPTSTAKASEAMLAVRNAIPPTALSAVALRIWALTSTTSLKFVRRPDRSPSPYFSHYAWLAKEPIPAHIRHPGFTNESPWRSEARSDVHP